MTYEETLEYLFKQLPMYQREGKSAFKKDLNNIIAICNLLDNPHKKFKSIHIAGTNGKGSTAHMLASVFQEAGYKTALYTSPHLKDFRERIRINGEMISKENVVDFVDQFQQYFEDIQPSFFEWTVALAFKYFAEENVDIAIIETGLGGRLDSTNVIIPELSIITNIGYDHMDMLGSTLNAIAFEKAGIIKSEVPVIVVNASGQEVVFEQRAKEENATLYYSQKLRLSNPLKTDLLGEYQKENLKGVYHAWLTLRKLGWKISYPQLEKALLAVVKNTGIRGRWEILSKHPYTIAETAHNKEGLTLALKQLLSLQHKQLHFVIGFVNDKELDSILSLFPKEANYYFCQANVIRALPAEKLQSIAQNLSLKGEYFESVGEAYKAAKTQAESNDIIYVGGSNFVVAEVL